MERPNDHGSGFTEETIPFDYLSQVGSHHLVLAAGTTTADFTVAAREDEIKEIDQTFSLELLAARGIEVRVSSQSQDELGNVVLGLTLGTTDVESVTLPANTVLSLGTDEEADGVATDSLASFTFAQETTIHRDREIEAKGTLTLHNTSADAPSIIGMVGAEHRGQYQVLDPFVEIILQGELNSQDESDTPFNTSSNWPIPIEVRSPSQPRRSVLHSTRPGCCTNNIVIVHQRYIGARSLPGLTPAQ